MFKNVSFALIALAFITVTFGCSEAPSTELNTSEEFIVTAQTNEAELYAPETYQHALDSLNVAKAEIKSEDSKFSLFRKYDKSKELLMIVQKIANQASEEAVQNKEKVRIEDSLFIDRINVLIAVADTTIKNAPKGKGTKADIELFKAEFASVNGAFQNVVLEYNGGKYLGAKSQFEAIETKLNNLINEIQVARTKVTSKI